LLELKSARKRLTTGNVERAGDPLDAVQNILHRVDGEIKRIVHDLHPPTLDALGLGPALRRYAERFEKYSAIPCLVQVLGEPVRLTPRDEISVYRLMQEALQNVSAHAQDNQAEVIVVFSPKILKLTVIDDGRGFELPAVQRDN